MFTSADRVLSDFRRRQYEVPKKVRRGTLEALLKALKHIQPGPPAAIGTHGSDRTIMYIFLSYF